MGERNRDLFFIVAYNHQSYVPKVVKRIPPTLLADPANELLIIDDASRDETFAVSEVVRTSLGPGARVTVLKNPVNQGYGGNQKLGYRYAIDHGFERVFLIHGDGQYAPEILCDFIAAYDSPEHPDAVFGTRVWGWRAPLLGGMPLYKLVGNRILTTAQNALLGSRLSEFHSGYRSYAVDLLRRIPFERNSNDFHFDTEIIIQALAAGATIRELPIPTHYGDEVCHVDGMRYAGNVIKATLHYRLQRLGFLYDRKFDLGETDYPLKTSRFSSHSRIVDRIPAGSRVLDLGCGRGHVAESLVAKGCEVDGVDCLSPQKVSRRLRRYTELDLNHASAEQLRAILRERRYDFIVMADVLEHLVDPEALLERVRAALPAEHATTVLATTGNVAFFIVRAMLALGQFNYAPRGILDRTHMRLFTRKSFRGMFEQCGYRVVATGGLPMPITAVLGQWPRAAGAAETVNARLADKRPGLFAYQLWIDAEAFPTTAQMLDLTRAHSAKIRERAPAGR